MTNIGSMLKAYAAAILVGLLPVWMVALPLDITSDPDGWQVFLRANSFAVPLLQLVFILIAMGTSFSPFQSFKELPIITKSALLVWLIIASVTSYGPAKDPLLASIGLAKLGVAALFLLALVNMRTVFGRAFLTRLWLSVGIGILLYAALWTIHILLLSPQGEDWIYRIPGVNNVRHTGHFAIAGVIAGLFTLIAYSSHPNIMLRWVLPLMFSIVGLGLALWTGSRGPLLASLVTMFAAFCIAARSRKTVFMFCAASVLASTAAVALLPVPHPIYGIARATGMADVAAAGDSDVSSGRTLLWSGALEKIAERPLLGWGVNQFVKLGPSKPVSFFHPHNLPLQMLFSGGIVSIMLTIMIFFPMLRRWKWPYAIGPSVAGVGGIIGILVYSLYDGALYFSYPITIFLFAIATSIAPAEAQPGPDRSS